jgi:hypothetical protein
MKKLFLFWSEALTANCRFLTGLSARFGITRLKLQRDSK